MRCDFIIFSEHAFDRMNDRGILPDEVEFVVQQGTIIKDYPNDQPSPSQLILGFLDSRPLHVVIARDLATDFCLVVTVYFPDSDVWDSTFKIKKQG